MAKSVAQQVALAYMGRNLDTQWYESTSSLLDTMVNGQPTVALQAAFYNAAVSEGVFKTTDSASALVNQIFLNVFGFGANVYEQTQWGNLISNGTISRETASWTIFKSYLGSTGSQFAAYQNGAQSKLFAMDAYSNALANNASSNLALANGGAASVNARTYVNSVKDQPTAAGAISTVDVAVASLTVVPGTTYTLTTGVDIVPGTANNDVINAVEMVSATGATVPTWTTGDAITGGAGTDTLNITQTAAVTMPLGVTVSGVERINVLSATTGTDINTSSFSGVEALSVTAPGAVTARAAATTAITVTDATQAGNAIAVNGGSTVTVTGSASVASAGTGGTVTVGATTAAAGAVTIIENVTSTNVTDGTVATGGAISVTGGTAVSVTQNISGKSVATENALVSAVGGAVTITGTVDTTSVTVNQTAAVAAFKSQTVGVHGITDGAVTITDVTQAAGTADRIATVSLANYGNSTVTSSALSTLNLTGGSVASGALTLDIQSATTPVTTLALNLNGGSFGAIGGTHAAAQTTLNVAGATAASTLANFTSVGVTALTVSGDKAVTFTSNAGLSALTSVTSTNSAGVTLGSAIGTGVTFTGGAGADSIILSNSFAKAITMGGGNDTVTYGGAAAVGKGSVVAGDGNDTIVMTGAQAETASASATFNNTFSGFETLQVTASANNQIINLAGINGVNNVVGRGVAAGEVQTLNGFQANGTLTLDQAASGANSGYTVNITNANLTTDVFNVRLSNDDAARTFGTVTAADIETINISTIDAGTTTALTAATVDSLTLVATAATTVNISGNNGLNLTNAGNTAITTFNASGVVGNSANDTAALLAVTFLSAKTTGSTTITGGAGDDVLTGVGATDTISGGLGADRIDGGAGIDILTGGAGADTFVVAGTAANRDTITDFTVGTGGDLLALTAAATKLGTAQGAAPIVTADTSAASAAAGAYTLTGPTTANADVIVLQKGAALTSGTNGGDLLASTNGSELLKALTNADAADAFTGITSAGTDGAAYFLAYQGGKAFLYLGADLGGQAADGLIVASEIALVGVMDAVAANGLVAANYSVLL